MVNFFLIFFLGQNVLAVPRYRGKGDCLSSSSSSSSSHTGDSTTVSPPASTNDSETDTQVVQQLGGGSVDVCLLWQVSLGGCQGDLQQGAAVLRRENGRLLHSVFRCSPARGLHCGTLEHRGGRLASGEGVGGAGVKITPIWYSSVICVCVLLLLFAVCVCV